MLIKLSHRDGESLVGWARFAPWGRFISRLFRTRDPTRDAETAATVSPLSKAPLLYIFLILQELGSIYSPSHGDTSTHTPLCLYSFVWISSKPSRSLLLRLNPSYYQSIPIYCHCSLNNRWDSEET